MAATVETHQEAGYVSIVGRVCRIFLVEGAVRFTSGVWIMNEGQQDRVNTRTLQHSISGIPLCCTLKPEREILLFMWSLGPLNHGVPSSHRLVSLPSNVGERSKRHSLAVQTRLGSDYKVSQLKKAAGGWKGAEVL